MIDEMWQQRDGALIAVGDMSKEHLRNVLRMILRSRRCTRRELDESISDELRNELDEIEWKSGKDW